MSSFKYYFLNISVQEVNSLLQFYAYDKITQTPKHEDAAQLLSDEQNISGCQAEQELTGVECQSNHNSRQV